MVISDMLRCLSEGLSVCLSVISSTSACVSVRLLRLCLSDLGDETRRIIYVCVQSFMRTLPVLYKHFETKQFELNQFN